MYDKDIENTDISNMGGDNTPQEAPIDDFSQFGDITLSQEEVMALAEQDAVAEQNEKALPPTPKKSSLTTPLLLVFLGVVLVAALFVIYSDSFEPSHIIAKIAEFGADKKSNKNVDIDFTNDEANVMPAFPTDSANGEMMANNTQNDEINAILNANSEEMTLSGSKKANKAMPTLPGANKDLTVEEFTPKLDRRGGRIGRIDPFNPAGNSVGEMFDVLIPPTNPTPDSDAQSLMSVKITGIMYSSDSPSAIVNIGGSDQLVRIGDAINGFHIDKITKDKVTVRNGKNTYTASVGEIVNVDNVGINAIPNINRKFAGPYSKGERIIEINTIN